MSDFPDEQREPSEPPIRARVPEHVALGAFSTGVIVMTAQSEFILDFVQNLGRPHQIVARVIMPHAVLPQLVDALQRNIELYKNRWGELPRTGVPSPTPAPSPISPPPGGHPSAGSTHPTGNPPSGSPPTGSAPQSGSPPLAGGTPPTSGSLPMGVSNAGDSHRGGDPPSAPAESNAPLARQASVQEIYDDLKIRDEFLSGAYANAVMIGHGPHEFSFDFITNFYPHSAVSARVFLAAGQIARLFDSLQGTWEQLKTRLQPPGRPSPPPGGHRPDGDRGPGGDRPPFAN